MEKKVYELKIDPELRDFIPPLSGSELEWLTDRLKEEGCTEPLTVWNGTIVDGHNRYRICHENNIPFDYEEKEFGSKRDAKYWMVKKQLGRRNVKPFQRCELVFPFMDMIAEEVEKKRREAISNYQNGRETGLNLGRSMRTADYLAKYADVSRATWNMAKVVIEEGDEETKDNVRKDNIAISAAYKMIRKKENAPEPKQKHAESPDNEDSRKDESVEEGTTEAGNRTNSPVIAARLDHSLPFVPVVKDDEETIEPGEKSALEDETSFETFKELMGECAEKAVGILDNAEKASINMIRQIRAELTRCYRTIIDKLEQMEAGT